MAAVEVVLIAVNQQDIASTNQGDRLRELDAWSEGPLFEDLMTFSLQHLRMVYLPNGFSLKTILTDGGLHQRVNVSRK